MGAAWRLGPLTEETYRYRASSARYPVGTIAAPAAGHYSFGSHGVPPGKYREHRRPPEDGKR